MTTILKKHKVDEKVEEMDKRTSFSKKSCRIIWGDLKRLIKAYKEINDG